jgi:hypothetical protein
MVCGGGGFFACSAQLKSKKLSFEITAQKNEIEKLKAELNGNTRTRYFQKQLFNLTVKCFSLLQFYIPIVGELEAVNYLPICDLIVKLNTKLTIGSFGFLHTHNLVFFKHNLIISNENFEENCGIIDKTLSILFFILINFQKPLSNVAQGHSSVDNAMEEMPLSYIYK